MFLKETSEYEDASENIETREYKENSETTFNEFIKALEQCDLRLKAEFRNVFDIIISYDGTN